MNLLVDLFGYLSVILHGLVIISQSMMLGGVLFLVFLARPYAADIEDGAVICRRTARMAAWAAAALVACELTNISMQTSLLVDTVNLPISNVLGADFARAGIAKIACAAMLAVLLFARCRVPAIVLLAVGAGELAAAVMTTHAAARLSENQLLLGVEALHQLGAAIWIGGIPCFVMALSRLRTGAAFRKVGARFSRMSMLGVISILLSGVTMAVLYIGSWAGFYGTAYGVMVGAKIALFVGLLGLGLGNFLVVERLRANPNTSVLRLRRFAEVEIGVGFTLFLAAASLTSVPPAVDLPNDRVSWAEIVERNTPVWPRLQSPSHDDLALIRLQDNLDKEAVARSAKPQAAFVPGAGDLPPRNAADIAWSEYNHHWAGVFVVVCGLLALLNLMGLRWARHWPLVFLGLAGFLFLRSDPEVWPMGTEGLIESLRDIEVLQHRVFVLLTVAFALFEWRVRVGGLRGTRAELVFPLVVAGGGALLLTHSHAIANIKDALLIELTHTPLALLAVAAGWSRWLEIRADGRVARVAGWIWPICFVLIGFLLLNYREA